MQGFSLWFLLKTPGGRGQKQEILTLSLHSIPCNLDSGNHKCSNATTRSTTIRPLCVSSLNETHLKSHCKPQLTLANAISTAVLLIREI